jgi:hypothetical protein
MLHIVVSIVGNCHDDTRPAAMELPAVRVVEVAAASDVAPVASVG